MAENLSIGEAILIHRKRKRLSQTELAELVDVSKSTISNYESNKTQPTFDVLVKISRSLEVPLSSLIPFISDAAPSAASAIPVFSLSTAGFKQDKLCGEHEYIAMQENVCLKPGSTCGIKDRDKILLFSNDRTYEENDLLLCTSAPDYKIYTAKYKKGVFLTENNKKTASKRSGSRQNPQKTE